MASSQDIRELTEIGIEHTLPLAQDGEGPAYDAEASTAVAVREGNVMISGGGPSPLSFQLPGGSGAAGEAGPEGFYSAEHEGFRTALSVVDDTGVAMTTIADSAGAPESFEYSVDVPDGGAIDVDPSGDAVVTDGDGEFVGALSAPKVIDELGAEFEAVYEVNGDTLTMMVPHTAESVEYPMVVTAFAGVSYVKSVKVTTEPKGKRYHVTPTALGRVTSGNLAYKVGFLEARKRGVPNRTNLYDQYRCHPMSGIARVKGTWNLESWRPNVGITKTVLKKCNP